MFELYPLGLSVEEVCSRAGIGRSSAYAGAEEISRRLNWRPPTEKPKKEATPQGLIEEMAFEIAVVRYERDHPGVRSEGEVRDQFAPEYKAFVEEMRAKHGITIDRASKILGVAVDTLKKFSRTAMSADPGAPDAQPPAPLPPEVEELANEYLRTTKGPKSVKAFCIRNPALLEKLSMDYRDVLDWLRKLGFVSPRGIFLKNTGLDRILRFKPNQLWHGDGKNIDVVFNGEFFRFAWQALADGKTTALVGGSVEDEETTEGLRASIEDAERKTGKTPLGIVLDNRLSENLPAIRSYLDERGIEIVKTFPGNSKSNSIIEENFNIVDRYVGKIVVNGTTPREIAKSICQAAVEILTQMKGRKLRKHLSYKSYIEVMEEEAPPTIEEQQLARERIKALADRLKNEQAKPEVSEQKKAAIIQAIEKTNPPHPDVFEKTLSSPRFTSDLILNALGILGKVRQEQPHKKFGHAYFGGILRKLVDQQGVEHLYTHLDSVYAQHWETMDRLKEQDLAASLVSRPEATCTRLALDFLNMPAPAFATAILLDMKKAFLVASKGSAEQARKLREAIAKTVLTSKRSETARREAILGQVFSWENFVRMADPAAGPLVVAPAGHA